MALKWFCVRITLSEIVPFYKKFNDETLWGNKRRVQ